MTPRRTARVADSPVDAEVALRFGCCLDLARKPDGALWWQFAAGAGHATAVYCLYLFHTRRGDLRDAHHWWHQHLFLGPNDDFIPPPAHMRLNLDTSSGVLRQAVERLKVDELPASFTTPTTAWLTRSRNSSSLAERAVPVPAASRALTHAQPSPTGPALGATGVCRASGMSTTTNRHGGDQSVPGPHLLPAGKIVRLNPHRAFRRVGERPPRPPLFLRGPGRHPRRPGPQTFPP